MLVKGAQNRAHIARHVLAKVQDPERQFRLRIAGRQDPRLQISDVPRRASIFRSAWAVRDIMQI